MGKKGAKKKRLVRTEEVYMDTLNIVKTTEKAKRCGTQITLQNSTCLHLGKLGSVPKLLKC